MVRDEGVTGRRACRSAPGGAQRGFGGFLLLFLVAGLAASTALFTFARNDPHTVANDRATTEALASVKAALIGYAVRRGGLTGNARPGELPCPDTDPPGHANYGLENTPCTTQGSLFGRVPWKTLGIPEPQDSAGETLWYALSPAFRDRSSNSDRINADTRGSLSVRGPDGTTLTTDAVAVVLAPGPAIGGQSRSLAGGLACTLAGGLSLGSLVPAVCANNYFESATVGGVTSGNAASPSGPFIAAPRSDTFNDRVSYITTSEFIAHVEIRVARELLAALQGYYTAVGYLPYTDNWEYSGGIADSGQNRGRFPTKPRDPGSSVKSWSAAQWGEGGTPDLPDWVEYNDWHNFFWYAVSRDYMRGKNCSTCTLDNQPVTVDGVAVKAIIISPGTPLDGAARLSDEDRRDVIAWYFEDAKNRNGANPAICPDVGELANNAPLTDSAFKGQAVCDQYVTPTATTFDRDRIYKIP